MTKLRRLFRNTTVLIVANALQPVLSFYLIVTISRELGVDGLGAYATVFNYLAIFQILAGFGLKNLLTRNVAQQPEQVRHYLWHGSLVVVPFSLLGIAGLIALIYFLDYGELLLSATALLSLALIAAALIDVCEGVLGGVERLHIVGYSAVLENVARVVASLVVLKQGFGLIALVLVFVVSRFVRAGYYYWYLHRHVVPFAADSSQDQQSRWRWDWPFVRHLVSQARVFAMTMVCVTVYWKIDVSILSKVRGMEEVGLYSAAYRFLMIAFVVIDSFVNSLFPIISSFYRGSTGGEEQTSGQFALACKKGLQLLLLLSLPVALVVSAFADQIILLVYGEEFTAAIPVLRILICLVVPYAISQIFAYALVASNNQRYDLFVNAVSMLASVGLNWVLIGKFGYIGAAWAALASITIYVGLQVPFIFRNVLAFEMKRLWLGGMKVLAAAGAKVGS